MCFFFFQAEDGIRDLTVTGVQTCALPIYGLDPPHGGHDPGKHSRLSNTSNVLGPRERRSNAIQRGACSSGAPGMPGKARTAPSPSHTGAWTPYNPSTSPSVMSPAARGPPPSPDP